MTSENSVQVASDIAQPPIRVAPGFIEIGCTEPRCDSFGGHHIEAAGAEVSGPVHRRVIDTVDGVAVSKFGTGPWEVEVDLTVDMTPDRALATAGALARAALEVAALNASAVDVSAATSAFFGSQGQVG